MLYVIKQKVCYMLLLTINTTDTCMYVYTGTCSATLCFRKQFTILVEDLTFYTRPLSLILSPRNDHLTILLLALEQSNAVLLLSKVPVVVMPAFERRTSCGHQRSQLSHFNNHLHFLQLNLFRTVLLKQCCNFSVPFLNCFFQWCPSIELFVNINLLVC